MGSPGHCQEAATAAASQPTRVAPPAAGPGTKTASLIGPGPVSRSGLPVPKPCRTTYAGYAAALQRSALAPGGVPGFTARPGYDLLTEPSQAFAQFRGHFCNQCTTVSRRDQQRGSAPGHCAAPRAQGGLAGRDRGAVDAIQAA